jgi:DNA-binding NarL/FixJ family response regulator
MRILIADDNYLVRNLIRQFLNKTASEISECSDGSEVLSAYKSFKPDWVLMDIDMPVVNGFTATRILKNYSDAARVIILSQYDTPEYRLEAAAAGANGYVQKDNLLGLFEFLFRDN